MSSDPTVPKPFYTSKTLWVAVLQIVILAIALVGQASGVFNLSPQVIAAGGIVSGVLLAILRMVTNSAIAGTPAAAKVQQAVEEKTMMAAMPPEPVTPPA